LRAAGLIALARNHRQRLHIDQENAKWLGGRNCGNPGLAIDPKKVRSNIVIFDCSKTGKTAVELCDALQSTWSVGAGHGVIRCGWLRTAMWIGRGWSERWWC